MNIELRFAVAEDVPVILHFIKIYKSIAAIPMDEWTVHRVTGQDLIDLANKGK